MTITHIPPPANKPHEKPKEFTGRISLPYWLIISLVTGHTKQTVG